MLNVDELRRNGMSDAGPSPADRMADEILYQRVQAWLKGPLPRGGAPGTGGAR